MQPILREWTSGQATVQVDDFLEAHGFVVVGAVHVDQVHLRVGRPRRQPQRVRDPLVDARVRKAPLHLVDLEGQLERVKEVQVKAAEVPEQLRLCVRQVFGVQVVLQLEVHPF